MDKPVSDKTLFYQGFSDLINDVGWFVSNIFGQFLLDRIKIDANP